MPASHQVNNVIAGKLYFVALLIALLTALIPPVSYFWLSYQAHGNEAQLESKLHAAFITQVMLSNPGRWQEEAHDLLEQDLTQTSLPESRFIIDKAGHTIAISGKQQFKISLTRSSELIDTSGKAVADIFVQRSLFSVLINTALIGIGGILMGAAIFLVLHTIPLRALTSTLNALHHETETAQKNERRLGLIIDNAAQGILTLTDSGIIESYNRAAISIFGFVPEAVLGQHISILIPGITQLKPGLHQSQAMRNSGQSFPVELTISQNELPSGSQYICLISDITERMRIQRKLMYMANYDSLTELPNRSLFKDRLTQAILRSRRSNHVIALMYLDLNKFKLINDTYGHNAGDALLCHVANLLRNTLRDTDSLLRSGPEDESTVSRLGGDEFTIILEGLNQASDAAIVARKIIDAFANPATLEGRQIQPGTSIGIAIYPDDASNMDELIKAADNAMYHAKRCGNNQFRFHNAVLNLGN